MARKRRDLTNQTFGRLLVIAPAKAKITSWMCVCSCGNAKIVAASELTRKSRTTRSCGCLRRETSVAKAINMAKALLKPETARNKVLNDYKQSCKKRGLSWSLTLEDFLALSSSPCYYCGSLPNNKSISHNKQKSEFIYNGLDRLNNNEGYSKENVVPCCFICNRAKNSLTVLEYTTWLSKLIEYQTSNKPKVMELLEREVLLDVLSSNL